MKKWAQYDEIFWERDHSHITFIIVYCCKCSLLLIIVVNLRLCLIFKLDCITSMNVCVGKNIVCIGFDTICFRTATGSLGPKTTIHEKYYRSKTRKSTDPTESDTHKGTLQITHSFPLNIPSNYFGTFQIVSQVSPYLVIIIDTEIFSWVQNNAGLTRFGLIIYMGAVRVWIHHTSILKLSANQDPCDILTITNTTRLTFIWKFSLVTSALTYKSS